MIRYPAVLFAVAAISVACWFRGADVIYFWDATVPLDPGRAVVAFAGIVRHDFWPSRLDLPALATIPYAAALWLFSGFGHDMRIGQRLLFVLLYGAPFVTAYAAFEGMLPWRGDRGNAVWLHRSISAAAALCYGCNAYVLFNLWRIFNLNTFLYAAIPLLVLFAFRYGRRGDGRDAIAFGAAALAAIPGLTNPGTVAGLLGGFGTWLVADVVARRSAEAVRRAAVVALLLAGVVAPFLAPQFLGVGSLVARLASEGTWPALGINTAHATLWSVLRLVGDGVTFESYPNGDLDYPWAAAYHAQLRMVLATSVVPVLALVAVFLQRSRTAVAAVVALVVVTVASLGPRAPLVGDLFFACFRSTTVCRAFRNPFDKFALTLPFWEAFLCAVTLGAVATYLRKRGVDSRALILGTFAVVALPMFAGWPLFTGAVERETSLRPSARVIFPDDFAASVRAVRDAAPVLVLPWTHVPLVAERWRSGYVGYDPLQFATYETVASTDSEFTETNELVERIQRALVHGPSRPALAATRALGFRSVAVRLDDDPVFTPEAGEATAITTHLHALGLRGVTTSTLATFDLGAPAAFLATSTVRVGDVPDVAAYGDGASLALGEADAVMFRHAGLRVLDMRPAPLVAGAAGLVSRAGAPLSTARIVPRVFALVSGDGSADYPGEPDFPPMRTRPLGVLESRWHHRYVETAVRIARAAQFLTASLDVRNDSAGDAALQIDFTDGRTTLGHAESAIAPRSRNIRLIQTAVPPGSSFAIVRLVAIPDRHDASVSFGPLTVEQFGREPRERRPAAFLRFRSPPLYPRVTYRERFRTSVELPPGPAVALAALEASAGVDWILETGPGAPQTPVAVAEGFAPVWIVAASSQVRRVVVIDAAGERGWAAFTSLVGLDLVLVLVVSVVRRRFVRADRTRE